MKYLNAFTVILILSNFSIFSLGNLHVEGGFLYNAWSENDSSQLLLIATISEKVSSPNKQPVQIIFCIDASQQMEGSPLSFAKKSVIQSLSLLSNNDLISVVSYTGSPEVEVKLKQLFGNNRKIAERSVDLIKCGYNRDLSLSIDKIDEQLAQFGIKNNAGTAGTYVIIISNGNPTKGITDYEKLLNKIIDLSTKYNAHFTTIGYDYHFNDDFMIKCATKTGGNAYLVKRDDIKFILGIVENEVKLIKSIAYKDVYLEIDLPSELEVSCISGGILKDNKIYINNLPPNYLKPVVIKLHGYPNRTKDFCIQANYSTMSNLRKSSLRKYIELKVNSENRSYNKDVAPSLLVYSILRDLTKSLNDFKKGKLLRKECAKDLKKKLLDMEQAKLKLNSSYFNWCFYILQNILFAVKNEAIEDELVIKIINYSFNQYLAGFNIP